MMSTRWWEIRSISCGISVFYCLLLRGPQVPQPLLIYTLVHVLCTFFCKLVTINCCVPIKNLVLYISFFFIIKRDLYFEYMVHFPAIIRKPRGFSCTYLLFPQCHWIRYIWQMYGFLFRLWTKTLVSLVTILFKNRMYFLISDKACVIKDPKFTHNTVGKHIFTLCAMGFFHGMVYTCNLNLNNCYKTS